MRFFLFCLIFWAFPAAHGAIVSQDVRPGIGANAEYLIGEIDKPAVLLLHGFLQTREFSTVAALASGLHDAGYTVLSPTLSLNIPSRTQSLACEAVHQHSMDDDVAEIGRWVVWLKANGHRAIVLVGHSFGSLQHLAYLTGQPDPGVKAYIGASLVEARIGAASRSALIAELEDRIARKQRELTIQPLSFCGNYTTRPEDLLSYVRWDQARTLAALKQAPVRTVLIMGDEDSMLGDSWMKALRHIRTRMVIVKGANHFMDGQHEFDLLEHTLASLARLGGAPAK